MTRFTTNKLHFHFYTAPNYLIAVRVPLSSSMSAGDSGNLRTVAIQLRQLSSDEENQPIIAREDGCLHALTGFVTGDDVEVASIAVTTVKNLASHADNFRVLRQEHELMDGLKDLLLSDDIGDTLRRDIFSIIEELTDDLNDYEMDELDELERKSGLAKAKPHPLDDPSFLQQPIAARLHIPGLSDELMRVRVEQLLIRESGVISVAFEIGAELAVLFTRAQPETLADFVAKMTGTTVEVLPPQKDEDEEDEKENEADALPGKPGYLDETGQRIKDVAKKNKKKKTVTQGASSLSDRLKKQREEETKKKARANRLLGSIGRGFNSGWGLW